MNNKILIGIIAGAIVIGAIVVFATKDKNHSAFTSGEVVIAEYSSTQGDFTVIYGEDNETARLQLDGVDNATYDLLRIRSASGAKYESADGFVVFWEHQGEAMVEINGEIVYEDAKITNTYKAENHNVTRSNRTSPVSDSSLSEDCDDDVDDDCDDESEEKVSDDDKTSPMLYQGAQGDVDNDGTGESGTGESDFAIEEEGIPAVDEKSAHTR